MPDVVRFETGTGTQGTQIVMTTTVVKVGGSLFDLPDLRDRLVSVLASLSSDRVLLVSGGGASTDVVRSLQRTHGLSDVTAHRLAMESMRVGEALLSELVPAAVLISSMDEFQTKVAVVQAAAFLANEQVESSPREDWDFTSDSISAWVAGVAKADRLLMLKSVPAPTSLDECSALDPLFAEYLGPTELLWCNLREGTQFETVDPRLQ